MRRMDGRPLPGSEEAAFRSWAGRDSSLVPFSDVSGQEGRAMRSMLVHVELEHRGALVLASLPRHRIHFNTIERTGRRFDEAQAPRDGV